MKARAKPKKQFCIFFDIEMMSKGCGLANDQPHAWGKRCTHSVLPEFSGCLVDSALFCIFQVLAELNNLLRLLDEVRIDVASNQ